MARKQGDGRRSLESRRSKHRSSGVALWLILAAACLLPLQASAQQKIPLRVAYTPYMTWLPFLVAQDTGIFGKHGLEITMTRFPDIADLPGSVGRQFDLAPTTATDFLNAVAGGLNLVAVAGETVESSKNRTYQVLVRSNSGINVPKDLSGKRIAGPGIGSVMHVALLYWVKLNGGDPDSIIGLQVPFPNMADQLKSGRIDAVEQLEPFVTPMLKAGYKSLGDPLLSVADPVLFPFWIANGDWARAHRPVLKAFTASLEDGLQAIRTNETAARAILAKYSHLPTTVVAKIPMPEFDFRITPAQVDAWRKVMVTQGRPLQSLNVDRLVVTGE